MDLHPRLPAAGHCRWQIDHTTEPDIGLRRILVLIRAGTGLQVLTYIFPATATDHFTLHTGGIGVFCIPADVRVHIMLEVGGAFIIKGRSPLGDVSGHAIQTEIVGPVGICPYSIESAVFRIVTTTGFEVSE